LHWTKQKLLVDRWRGVPAAHIQYNCEGP
jgi:hypothetical protein